jgi:hypothetical protein
MVVAVIATLVAAALALALVAAVQRSTALTASPSAPAVYTVHLDQEHARSERND